MVFRIVAAWRYSAVLKVPEGITFNYFIFGTSCQEAKSYFGMKTWAERANGTYDLHGAFKCTEKEKPNTARWIESQTLPFRHRITEQEEARRVWSVHLDVNVNQPGFPEIQTWGSGRWSYFSVLYQRWPCRWLWCSKDIRPHWAESCECFSRACFLCLSQRESLEREREKKSPECSQPGAFAQP